MNWASHPMFGTEVHSRCKKQSTLREFGCAGHDPTDSKSEQCPGLYDHEVCLDKLPEPIGKVPVLFGKNRESLCGKAGLRR